MKRWCFLFTLVALVSIAHSQEIKDLERSLDSLNNLITFHQGKVNELKSQCIKIEKLINERQMEQTGGETYVAKSNLSIRNNLEQKIMISMINKGDKVKVIGRSGDYFQVTYKNYTGWVLRSGLLSEDEVKANAERARILAEQKALEAAKTAEEKKKAEEERKKADEEAFQKRSKDLENKYGSTIALKILGGYVWLGMTEDMALESMGRPNDINRSVGSWGVHEQWVYKNGRYLYFENGKLTSWQD